MNEFLGSEKHEPSTEITVSRFQELLESEIKLNMIKSLCLNEKYVLDGDIRRILGMSAN